MEEVDKIIIQSLISIGCEINQDVKLIAQFDQDLFIESVSKLLNILNSNNEPLPTKLPPNTGVKFRICTKFANVCQQLGYKNEIGYQTFLYTNESDMRRLLMFLVEKLTKDVTTSTTDQSDQKASNKSKNLNVLIAQQLKKHLSLFWIPPYCKLNGIRVQDEQTFVKEGCKYLNGYRTLSLGLPHNYLKGKNSNELQNFVNKHCKYVTNQAIRKTTDILGSLMEQNLSEKLREQSFLKQDINSQERKKLAKEKTLNELKNYIKVILKKINESSDSFEGSSCLTRSDLAEIELTLQSPSNKNLLGKGSRFTHSEKLQFTKENENNASIVTGSSEEKKEEEIKNLKETLDNLNNDFESLERDVKKLNNLIEKLEQDCNAQTNENKTLEEKIAIKQRTVNLINDAPMNILKLKEEIKNHEKKMSNLRNQWEAHQRPLEEQKEALKQKLLDKKFSMQQKLEETKRLKIEIEQINIDLSNKDKDIKQSTQELEKISKESSKTTNRQFYTKRILEIVANIEKQKKEIDKVLIETKMIQKEINQLSGKLERIFNANDELIFKDAKKDETNKKVYKLFIMINDNYEQLIETIEQSSHIDREIRDLEDQITSESQNKVDENMEKLMSDYKQIKEENDQLISKVKSKK